MAPAASRRRCRPSSGTAVTLPIVSYLGSDFVPAYSSAELLQQFARRRRTGNLTRSPARRRGPARRGAGRRPGPAAAAVDRDRAERRRRARACRSTRRACRIWRPTTPRATRTRSASGRCRSGLTACWPASPPGSSRSRRCGTPRPPGCRSSSRARACSISVTLDDPADTRSPGPRRRRRRAGGLGGRAAGCGLPDRRHLPRRRRARPARRARRGLREPVLPARRHLRQVAARSREAAPTAGAPPCSGR